MNKNKLKQARNKVDLLDQKIFNLKKHLFLEIRLKNIQSNVKIQIFYYVLAMFGIGKLLQNLQGK